MKAGFAIVGGLVLAALFYFNLKPEPTPVPTPIVGVQPNVPVIPIVVKQPEPVKIDPVKPKPEPVVDYGPLPRRSYQYKAAVIREARKYWGVNANVALFAGQFHQESLWNNDAKSPVGAKGMGQFMPATGKEVHERYKDLNSLAMYSELWSIRALFLYDRQLYNAIKPLKKETLHPCSHYAMMLSAYNGGLGWLNRDRRLTIAAGDNPDIWWGNVEKYSNRAGWAIKENRGYPERIMLKHALLYLAHGYPGENVCSVN